MPWSDTAADHAEVLALAIDALPERDRAGHHWNDDPADAVTEIVIRADVAGETHWLAEDPAERNCWFSLGYGIDNRVRAGVTQGIDGVHGISSGWRSVYVGLVLHRCRRVCPGLDRHQGPSGRSTPPSGRWPTRRGARS